MSEEVAAIILAGGQSTRMGQDKALLALDGTPLLRRVYDAVKPCVSGVYVVTPRRDRYAPILPPDCQWIAEPAPLEGTPPAGPLAGFAQGLAEVQTPWIMLLACDLPGLTVGGIGAAIAQVAQVPDPAIALLPRDDQGWQPLCGIYRRRCYDSLSRFLAQGGRSFQRWLAGETLVELQSVAPGMVFNCNTPGDVQTWHQSMGRY